MPQHKPMTRRDIDRWLKEARAAGHRRIALDVMPPTKLMDELKADGYRITVEEDDCGGLWRDWIIAPPKRPTKKTTKRTKKTTKRTKPHKTDAPSNVIDFTTYRTKRGQT